MSDCASCNLSVNRSAKDGVVCSQCGSIFHGKCVGGGKDLSEAELELMSKNWSCKNCLSKLRIQRNSNSDTPVKSANSLQCQSTTITSDVLEKLLSDLKNEILGGQARLEKSLEICRQQLSSNSDIITKQSDIIKGQEQIILALQNDNIQLKKNIDLLTDKLDALEQYGRKNTLEIRGVPVADNENVADLVIATCKAVGVTVGTEAIDVCHRLKKSAAQSTPAIVAKFVRRDVVHQVLAGKKQVRRLSSRVLGVQGDDLPIYINVSLTLVRKRILAQAKKLQKEMDFKYVWVDWAGNVKIRKVDRGKVFTLNTEKDLNSFMTTCT